MKTPVLFLVFNRPHLTSRVFETIRKVQPEKLFIMADGPRPGVTGDDKKCLETRKIVEEVDWKCNVKTLFFDKNRGCGPAVSEGITWFFENVEQGIILEDDCLPDDSFFHYCEVLLDYYKDDQRVKHINGNNFNADSLSIGSSSYLFGSYPQVWGWATWRRSWKYYDFHVVKWPEIKKTLLADMNWTWYERLIQKRKYNELHLSKQPNTWDYQWYLAVFYQKGLTIVPKVNLISNIGFGSDATHTNAFCSLYAELDTTSINFPLQHPKQLAADTILDKEFRRKMIGTPSTILRMVKNRILSTFWMILRLKN